MNAFRPAITRSSAFANALRRKASTSAVSQAKKSNFAKDWLSDSSTYPLMVIMGFAMTFCTGACIHALTSYKDVTLDPSKRNTKLQPWGQEEVPSYLSRVVGSNAYAPEGMGVDHEKWAEGKKEYYGKK